MPLLQNNRGPPPWFCSLGMSGAWVWVSSARSSLAEFSDFDWASVVSSDQKTSAVCCAPVRAESGMSARYHTGIMMGMAMTLRLEAEDEKALALLAEVDGVSKQEATVRAIREAAARRVREDKVRLLSNAARARYSDLLDRLGQ